MQQLVRDGNGIALIRGFLVPQVPHVGEMQGLRKVGLGSRVADSRFQIRAQGHVLNVVRLLPLARILVESSVGSPKPVLFQKPKSVHFVRFVGVHIQSEPVFVHGATGSSRHGPFPVRGYVLRDELFLPLPGAETLVYADDAAVVLGLVFPNGGGKAFPKVGVYPAQVRVLPDDNLRPVEIPHAFRVRVGLSSRVFGGFVLRVGFGFGQKERGDGRPHDGSLESQTAIMLCPIPSGFQHAGEVNPLFLLLHALFSSLAYAEEFVYGFQFVDNRAEGFFDGAIFHQHLAEDASSPHVLPGRGLRVQPPLSATLVPAVSAAATIVVVL